MRNRIHQGKLMTTQLNYISWCKQTKSSAKTKIFKSIVASIATCGAFCYKKRNGKDYGKKWKVVTLLDMDPKFTKNVCKYINT